MNKNWLLLATLFCTSLQAAELNSGVTSTPAALASAAALCSGTTTYPPEKPWGDPGLYAPLSATTGTPQIDQLRNGAVIATYTGFSNQPNCNLKGDGTDNLNPAPAAASGCGPFTRSHTWRLWQPGDVFNVYPAVYSGPYNQPWFGPQFDDPTDYQNNISHTPDNVTIHGITVNNVRPVILLNGGSSDNTLGQAPVYFDASNGMTFDNINVVAGSNAAVGKSGLYIAGANNLTLSNARISNFSIAGGNGIFSAGISSGFLNLTNIVLDHNGGTNGPAHNAYINASTVDPNFTLNVASSYSFAAYYGHLFKSRAQNNNFIANVFQGGLPPGKATQAETYDLDIPNGGKLVARNNIFIKNLSGPNSNGIGLAFLMEGANDGRVQSADIENNTFVTYSSTYNGINPNFPLAFLYPIQRPDSSTFPKNITVHVAKNAFVGYCTPNTGTPLDYRGQYALIEGFSELNFKYSLATKYTVSDATLAKIFSSYVPEIGTQSFNGMKTPIQTRATSMVGAED